MFQTNQNVVDKGILFADFLVQYSMEGSHWDYASVFLSCEMYYY
jgi:hypothetical protein